MGTGTWTLFNLQWPKGAKKKGSVTRELIEAIMKGTLHIDQPFVEQIIA